MATLSGGVNMSNVNADLETIRKSAQNLKSALESVSRTKSHLSSTYQKLGVGWNDKKYKELEDIIIECNKALSNLEKILQQSNKYAFALASSLQEYENVNLDPDKGIGLADLFAGSTNNRLGIQNNTSKSVIERLSNVGVKNVNFNGIPEKVQNEIASAFEKMSLVFPESKGVISAISISNSLGDSTPAATGYSTRNGTLQTYMSINPTWFSNENLEDMINECSENGSWAGTGIGGIINHEIGHALHLQLDAEELGMQMNFGNGITSINQAELSNRWLNNTTTNNIRDTVLSNLSMTRDDVYDNISSYADTDGSECFAECIADYTTTDNPNVISISIINEYRRRLSNIRNGGI